MSGTHAVMLGASMQGRNEQDASYHGIRLNFQPGTMDHTLPAQLSGGSSNGSGEYALTVPSRDGARHVFKGPQVPAKEVDCLLIWNEERGAYVLERMESVLRLEHQRNSNAAAATGAAASHSRATSGNVSASLVGNASASASVGTSRDVDEMTSTAARRHTPSSSPSKTLQDATTAKTKNESSSVPSSAAASRLAESSVMARKQRPKTPPTKPEASLASFPEIHLPAKRVEQVEEDESDLDDLADMLESTLDESRSTKTVSAHLPVAQPVAAPVKPMLSHTRSREDESSEEED